MKFLIFLSFFGHAEQLPEGLSKKDMTRFHELTENCMMSFGGSPSQALKLVQCRIKAHRAIIEKKNLERGKK